MIHELTSRAEFDAEVAEFPSFVLVHFHQHGNPECENTHHIIAECLADELATVKVAEMDVAVIDDDLEAALFLNGSPSLLLFWSGIVINRMNRRPMSRAEVYDLVEYYDKPTGIEHHR